MLLSVASKIRHEIEVPGYDETVIVEITLPRIIANKLGTVDLHDELAKAGVFYIGKLVQNLPKDTNKN